jgi:arginine utilization regulatory protein
MSGPPPAPEPPPEPPAIEPSTHDFRWQALFQRTREPLFVLNRRRRFLFVNRAWEQLTGVSAAEARGLVCLRRTPLSQDPPDLVVRSLCSPPPEVWKGKPGRSRRLLPGAEGAARWWDLDFLPLEDDQGLLCVLGKITVVSRSQPPGLPPLPDKLMALREGRVQGFGFDQLASSLPALQRVLEQVCLAGQSSVPVLLLGEAGTGKQWIARTLHYQGSRREEPFVALDCARLPSSLLAPLLLPRDKRAGKATYYLREPAYLARDLQKRLCDQLHEAGDSDGPRFLAGTCLNPVEEVRAGRLLEDLSCALSTLIIQLPPLRQRRADLPLLVERLLARIHVESVHRVTGLMTEAWEVVQAYAWPGNLRELHAVLQHACRHATGDQLEADHLPAALRLAVRLEQTPRPSPDKPLPLEKLLEEAERRLIQLALRKAKGNCSRAAEMLAIWRARLLRRIEALGIKERRKEEG